MKRLLYEGRAVSEVADLVGASRQWVTRVAHRHGLPLNPTIAPGSATETRILLSLLHHGVCDDLDRAIRIVAAQFSHAPCNIRAIFLRVHGSANEPPTLVRKPNSEPSCRRRT